MNFKTLTAILFVIFTFHQSASAYSSIFTIDGWSTAQLNEAGKKLHEILGKYLVP